jgi:hypothetical protein
MKTTDFKRTLITCSVLILTATQIINAQNPSDYSNLYACSTNSTSVNEVQQKEKNDFNMLNTSSDKQALKNKIDEYQDIMKRVDILETKTESELQEINCLSSKAHSYINNMSVTLRKAKKNNSLSETINKKLNTFLDSAYSFSRKEDSVIAIANTFKDSAVAVTKKARAVCLEMNQEYDETHNPVMFNYVVQLGAGNMSLDYFDKIRDIKVVTPEDGVKRYVIGVYNTKEEALSAKEKMTQLGYAEAFVRTMDSLYQ